MFLLICLLVFVGCAQTGLPQQILETLLALWKCWKVYTWKGQMQSVHKLVCNLENSKWAWFTKPPLKMGRHRQPWSRQTANNDVLLGNMCLDLNNKSMRQIVKNGISRHFYCFIFYRTHLRISLFVPFIKANILRKPTIPVFLCYQQHIHIL